VIVVSVFRLLGVTSLVVTAIVVPTGTSVVTVVVVVAT
jgi:hypothetical protein